MNQKLLSMMTMAAIIGMAAALTGCPTDPPGNQPPPGGGITYTAAQTGGADGTTDSTGIVFTFSASVDSLNLTAADITVGGKAAKGTSALSGTGATRTLAITVTSAGTATVQITKTGIEAATKNVTVYKAGQTAPDPCECNGNKDDCECGEDCECVDCEEETTPTFTAHAGADQTQTLAQNLTITLNGTGSTGTISAYAWECASYTADQGTVSAAYTTAQVDALITNPRTATATVAPRKAGTYVFRLTVTDSAGGSDSDEVTVVVKGYLVEKTVTATIPGLSSGFPKQSIDFATNYSPVIAGGDFEDGDVVYTITDNSNPPNTWDGTAATGYIIAAAPYVPNDVIFTLNFKYKDGTIISSKQITASTVTLGSRFSGVSENPEIELSLEKTITELPPTAQAAAHAGDDQTQTLAQNLTITLNGTGSTGDISGYAWECASYTADQGTVNVSYTAAEVTALITNKTAATTTVAPRKAGTYVFKLTVTDSAGGSATDEVTVVVKAAEVTVNLAEFNLTTSNLTSLDLKPANTGWSGFDYDKLSFTLSETDTDGNTTTYYNYDNNMINVKSSGFTGTSSPHPRITQYFLYDGKPVGSFSFHLRTQDRGSGYVFHKVYQEAGGTAYDNFDTFTPPVLTISEIE